MQSYFYVVVNPFIASLPLRLRGQAPKGCSPACVGLVGIPLCQPTWLSRRPLEGQPRLTTQGCHCVCPPYRPPCNGNPSDPLGTESPAENCRQRPGLRMDRGLAHKDSLASSANGTVKVTEDTSMEVSLNLLKDSRSNERSPPSPVVQN